MLGSSTGRLQGRLRRRDDAGLSITMIIRKHNAILYASASAPMEGVKNTRLGKIERIHSDRRCWTSRAKIRNSTWSDAGDACCRGGTSLSTSTRVATTSCRCWCVFLFCCFPLAVHPHRYARGTTS
ncbi:hypothetical protein KIF59_01840 [Enterobacter cloacae subsp. cloacae]|nr:hypothetical protein [Enterobacter cloacae subsp. cloacae]